MSFRLINDAAIDDLSAASTSPSPATFLVDVNPNPVFGAGSGLRVVMTKIGTVVNITWEQIPNTPVTNVGIPSFSGLPTGFIPKGPKSVPVIVTNNGTTTLGRMVIVGGGDPVIVVTSDLFAGTFTGVAGINPGAYSYDVRV